MTAEHSEDETPPSCLSCLFGSKKKSSTQNGQIKGAKPESEGFKQSDSGDNNKLVVTGDCGGRRSEWMKGSVYYSARNQLNHDDLEALRVFEEAAHASGSVYFDASELDNIDEEPAKPLTYAPATLPNPHPRASILMDNPATLLKALEEPRVKLLMAGYPGELTQEEVAKAKNFRNQLKKRKDGGGDGHIYEDMVRAFRPVEEEPYALCRFLRARAFDVDEVFKMIDEAMPDWKKAAKHDFFPDPDEAIGAPTSVLLTQFPSIYSGSSKSGVPVNYFRAGRVSVEGIDCVTDLEKLIDYSWHGIMYMFKEEVAKAQKKMPDAVRCESLAIMDLEGLSSSTLNARTLEVLRATINTQKSFPELLNAMVIVNAPRFFTFFWKVIKGMLHPRTQQKIAMFSDLKSAKAWLSARIDESELLSDYGGKGESFDSILRKKGQGGLSRRRVVKLLSINRRALPTLDFELQDDETIDINVYTRTTAGADFSILKDGSEKIVDSLKVQNLAKTDTPKPFSVDLVKGLKGPGKFRVAPKSQSYDFDHFLVVGKVN